MQTVHIPVRYLSDVVLSHVILASCILNTYFLVVHHKKHPESDVETVLSERILCSLVLENQSHDPGSLSSFKKDHQVSKPEESFLSSVYVFLFIGHFTCQ